MDEIEFNLVVLDGANIIHNNLINGEKTLEPKRLDSAIQHCENKGWTTIAALKHGTYYWAKHNSQYLDEGDFQLLQTMVDEGKVELISQEDEDIYWITTALEDEGYIITKDTFEDKWLDDGTLIERERSNYPEIDWDEVDMRTLTYEFIGGKFRCPELPQKRELPPNHLSNQTQGDYQQLFDESQIQIEKLMSEIKDLKQTIRILTAKQKSDHKVQTPFDDEVADTFDQLLRDGEEISTTKIYQELAKKILHLPDDITLWPQNWAKDLKGKLGFPRNKKYTSFFEDLSQIVTQVTGRRIQFDGSRSRAAYVG